MKTGVELIAEERQRQVSVEGWTSEHDDNHDFGEMIGASVEYSLRALDLVTDGEIVEGDGSNGFWPNSWDYLAWWKPSNEPIPNLVKAGALIAAEIDRLQRAAGMKAESHSLPDELAVMKLASLIAIRVMGPDGDYVPESSDFIDAARREIAARGKG